MHGEQTPYTFDECLRRILCSVSVSFSEERIYADLLHSIYSRGIAERCITAQCRYIWQYAVSHDSSESKASPNQGAMLLMSVSLPKEEVEPTECSLFVLSPKYALSRFVIDFIPFTLDSAAIGRMPIYIYLVDSNPYDTMVKDTRAANRAMWIYHQRDFYRTCRASDETECIIRFIPISTSFRISVEYPYLLTPIMHYAVQNVTYSHRCIFVEGCSFNHFVLIFHIHKFCS